MTAERQVLVVDSAEGTLAGVMEELDLLGFRVVWVPTLGTAFEFVKASSRVSLVVVSAASAQDGGAEFLAGVKELRPSLRIIWGVSPDGMRVRKRRASLDSLIPEPIQPEALRETVSSLLAEYFYPSSIATAIKSAALEILGTFGDFKIEGDSFLVPNQTSLSDLSSIIGFSGEASGHLMVSVSSVDAKTLHRRLLPGTVSIPIDRLEDLVGELCNQILGRINAFFAQYSVSIQQTTPIFIRAAGSTMRYAGRHPSFGVQLSSGSESVSIEYYLADFNKSKLLVGEVDQVMGAGEIRYL